MTEQKSNLSKPVKPQAKGEKSALDVETERVDKLMKKSSGTEKQGGLKKSKDD